MNFFLWHLLDITRDFSASVYEAVSGQLKLEEGMQEGSKEKGKSEIKWPCTL